MFRRLWAAAALLIAACFAVPACAADPVPTPLPFTQGGVACSEWTWNDGVRFIPGSFMGGWTGTAWKPLYVDPTTGYLGTLLAPEAATATKHDSLLAAVAFLTHVDPFGQLLVTLTNPGSGPSTYDTSAFGTGSAVVPVDGRGPDGEAHVLATNALGDLAMATGGATLANQALELSLLGAVTSNTSPNAACTEMPQTMAAATG